MKKVLLIFSIVLILFSLTVPCFAYSEFGGSLLIDNLGKSGFVDIHRETASYYSVPVFYFPVESGKKYAIFCYSDPLPSSSFTQFLISGVNFSTIYDLTRYNFYVSSPYIFTASSSQTLTLQFVCTIAGDFYFDYSFFIFEIDLSDTASTVSFLMSKYSFNVRDNLSNGSHTFFVDGFNMNPVIDFHSSVFSNIFGFINQDSFFPLFIFVSSLLSICIVIFLIVFMFKKFAR